MGSQSAAADRNIEQRPFYTAFASGLFKGERDTVVVGIRILSQPLAYVVPNCCLTPTSITKIATISSCYRLG